MSVSRLLIANRGEIACRIIRAAAELGIESFAVHSDDDATGRPVELADRSIAIGGLGAAAYLDAARLIEVAVDAGADALHPGYGFLSEDAGFAQMVEAAGITWIGPRPETLARFGDKAEGRAIAAEGAIPVIAGTDRPTTIDEAKAFLAEHPGGIMLKAIAGGGGRGMRRVIDEAELAGAFERCTSEAAASFGCGDLYIEELVDRARHVEVQVIADDHGNVAHLWERECSLQRRNQKIVENAPATSLSADTRSALRAAAVAMARATDLRSLATFEFLVDGIDDQRWFFIECNPRLQVEHTVTEEVTGVDLVRCQLLLAAGFELADIGIDPASPPPAVGTSVQARVNAEVISPDGDARPTGGELTRFDLPTGAGIRCETAAYTGQATSPAFDSLLVKVIAHSRSTEPGDAIRRLRLALAQLVVEGVETTAPFLHWLLDQPEAQLGVAHTRTVADIAARYEPPGSAAQLGGGADSDVALAGIALTDDDPLAVLDHGRRDAVEDRHGSSLVADDEADGTSDVLAPLQGTVVSLECGPGAEVAAGQAVAVMEAMKMEHVVTSPTSGEIVGIHVRVGDAVFEGHRLVSIAERDVITEAEADTVEIDLDHIRPDLDEVRARHRVGHDDQREDAVAKRHSTGRRTARENVADLVDEGTFVEYGSLMVAAQRKRRTIDDLIARTPADGLIGGLGAVNGGRFGPEISRCAVMSYDYTVLAGTQGHNNHRKKDRLFELTESLRVPLVLFAEGGGGRPGDTDGLGVAGLDGPAFRYFARLSGLVPLVGITTGYCFAGNAALLGCCDVVIATEGSNIGMGGPAMIEGGGLGVFHPTEVGPMDVQVPNGVVDIAVADEAEAVAAAKTYLSYFQGRLDDWDCADQRLLRHVIPENRLRIYDVREVIDKLFDTGSVLELRAGFGVGMVTALARIEGRPVGVIANNPTHLAGAIDSPAADKAARFMQLCDAFDLPIIAFCDTPGIMVGPESETEATVRHASRMFVVGANITVPYCTIVLRKGYGLGAQAMAGGVFRSGLFTLSWPTGEFGGMGLEGAVKLGYRNELAAIEDPDERTAAYEERVARMYEVGKAINMAAHFEIDGVIDPAESRHWITSALASAPTPPARQAKKRPNIDTW